MAIVSKTGFSITHWTEVYYNLFATLTSAGWCVLGWSDGTTHRIVGSATGGIAGTVPGPYAAVGNVDPIYPWTGTFTRGFLTASSQTNKLGAANSWIVMRQPKGSGSSGYYEGKRTLTFKWSNAAIDDNTCIMYSSSGSYEGGTATNPPNASDALYLFGGSFSVYKSLFRYNVASYINSTFNIVADNGISCSSPYSFAVFGERSSLTPPGSEYDPNSYCMLFYFDAVETGSVKFTDKDPFVFGCHRTTAAANKNVFSFYANSGSFGDQHVNQALCWYNYGSQQSASAYLGTYTYVSTMYDRTFSPVGPIGGFSSAKRSGHGVNTYTGDIELYDIVYAAVPDRNFGKLGYKGKSWLFKACGVWTEFGQAVSIESQRDWYTAYGTAIRWGGNKIIC